MTDNQQTLAQATKALLMLAVDARYDMAGKTYIFPEGHVEDLRAALARHEAAPTFCPRDDDKASVLPMTFDDGVGVFVEVAGDYDPTTRLPMFVDIRSTGDMGPGHCARYRHDAAPQPAGVLEALTELRVRNQEMRFDQVDAELGRIIAMCGTPQPAGARAELESLREWADKTDQLNKSPHNSDDWERAVSTTCESLRDEIDRRLANPLLAAEAPAEERIATLRAELEQDCYAYSEDGEPPGGGWERGRWDGLRRTVDRIDELTIARPSGSPEPWSFRDHLARQSQWSEKTFGPGTRRKGVIDHIRKELDEVEESDGNLAEWIDVVILALDGAWRSGADPDQIIAALREKHAKNEARSWPDWRKMSSDKAIEHDRSDDEPASEPEGDEQGAGEIEAKIKRWDTDMWWIGKSAGGNCSCDTKRAEMRIAGLAIMRRLERQLREQRELKVKAMRGRAHERDMRVRSDLTMEFAEKERDEARAESADKAAKRAIAEAKCDKLQAEVDALREAAVVPSDVREAATWVRDSAPMSNAATLANFILALAKAGEVE